jgi:tRNA U34 2-thiouridine synthase MnmA/TrmU
MSGGLDSTLAAAVVARQDVTVIGVNLQGAYCPGPLEGLSKAQVAATQVGIELVTLPIEAEFIAMVKNPKHGRGRNMNPCIDCHTLMIRRAWAYGQSRGAGFVVTGEVLGQRPMSQNRQSLALVARESGIGDRLLRPLSAKLLEPTRPELAGLIDRERLYDIQGRTRERQFALAIEYRIKEYPQPAGGCLLTEKVFSARLREAFARGEDSVALVELLRFGRHFRLASGSRVVLGRNKQENAELLARLPDSAALIDATALPGPLGLLIPDSGADDRLLAARLCVAFSDKRAAGAQRVRVCAAGAAAARVEPDAVLSVAALEPDAVSRLAVQSAPQSA